MLRKVAACFFLHMESHLCLVPFGGLVHEASHGNSVVFSLQHYPVPAQWILSRLDKAIADVHKGLESYDFALAVTAVYNFWLYDFCDVYLVCVKARTQVLFGKFAAFQAPGRHLVSGNEHCFYRGGENSAGGFFRGENSVFQLGAEFSPHFSRGGAEFSPCGILSM